MKLKTIDAIDILIAIVLVLILFLLVGSARAAQLQDDPTPTFTPNATEMIQTAQAQLATPAFTSTIHYGDLAEISILFCLGVVLLVGLMVYLVNVFLIGKRGE
jgi:hypothetical protein